MPLGKSPSGEDANVIDLARRRSLFVFCLLGGGIGFLSSLHGISRGEIVTQFDYALAIYAPLLLAATGLLARHSRNINRFAVSVLAYAYFVISANALNFGAMINHASFFLIGWAFVASIVFGLRGAFIAVLASITQYAVLITYHDHIRPNPAMSGSQELGIWIAIGCAFVLLLICLCAAIFHREMMRASERLAKALRSAESADEAKGQFLANMSHEIRTPMNGVMGMAELLAKSELNAKQRMFADIIVKSGNTLVNIINDILDFSKIDAGQMTLDSEPFNVVDTFEDVAITFAPKVSEKDLELTLRIDPDLPKMLVGDAARLRQITGNMVGNAIKFTEIGHIGIDVSGKIHSGTGARVTTLRVKVTDTGIGIAKEKQGVLFKKFSQVDPSPDREHDGMGLGLAIVSALLNLMGGRTGFESTRGVGSTFWFEVPLAVSDRNPELEISDPPVDHARILIVDDNKTNRAILSEQMHSWGHESAAVVDGHEALAFLRVAAERRLTVDCVVLDYQMPGMTGLEVAKSIAEDAQIPETPVLLLTSVDNISGNHDFSDVRIAAYLTKPARSAVLRQTLNRIIAEKQGSVPEEELELLSA